ncbi:MAG: response regulator [Pseudomonadota bacterium]
MITIINWIREIENLAHDVYLRSAEFFRDDEKLSAFLNHIAEDEAWHYHVMSSALEYCRNRPAGVPEIAPAVTIESETDDGIKSAFQQISDKLSAETLTKEFLINQILLTEYSEWNDMFQYVVNTLKKTKREFLYAATRIQNHKKFIEVFLENIPHMNGAAANFKTLPSIWEEKILIIEDDESLAQLIQAILKKEGKIDIASNGAEGLQKIKENYYKLIISDFDMPEMDGIACYTHAAERYPNIHERFLFFTGNLSPEIRSFLNQNQLAYLKKPEHIKKIRELALQILLKPDRKMII